MKEREDFVHLHTHTDLSQLDGCGKIPDYVKTAAQRGNPAFAITDHGTMRGYLALAEESEKADIKGITGIEFYVARDHRRRGITPDERAALTNGVARSEQKAAVKAYEDKEGIRDRWHLTAWAKNEAGLRSLYRLSSLAWIDGFYYKPRIDLDLLEEHRAGLIIGSGCLSSPINDSWNLGKRRQALGFADRLHDTFGEDLWLEIQPHDIRDQVEANKLMVRLRKRYGRVHKLLATQDAHYVEEGDGVHHDVLLCIGSNSNLSDPNRFKFDNHEFWLKTRKQMAATFRRYHPFLPDVLLREALDSTVELAERCTAKVETDYHKCLLPDSGVSSERGQTDVECIKSLCVEGWGWRKIRERARRHADKHGISVDDATGLYRARLKMELRALVRQRFLPYFLMIYDLYRFARLARIMTGPGRGSVAGSLVAYLLGLTAVDPIEHGLIFERFINPNRVDMPDVDMDFEDRRRKEVMDYLRQKYGRDKVCQIATVGKLSGKQCLRDVSRVLEVPLAEVNQVTNSIIERSSGDERASQTIEDSFKDFDVCRKFNKRYPDVLRHAKKLEGMAKNLGIHAAGAVASPIPLVELLPLEIRKHNGEDIVVSATDMYGVAAVGLVKLDVLGLRTLTVLKEACEAVERRHGRTIDLESADDVDLNDPKVLAGFTRHDYGGVFQYDTPSADKVCEGVGFSSFEDVAAMTALNRPGTARSGLATKYVERKKDPTKVSKVDFHPKVSEITADTLGIIVYQEHVIKIFTDIAGFAPGTADSLRKKIAKKVGDETIGKERDNFIRGAMANTPGMSEAVAAKIIDAITFFGCVPFWSKVLTPDGPRDIDLLKVGDDVISVRPDGKLVGNRVKSVLATGKKPLKRIHLAGLLEVEATGGHHWFCSDGKYRTTDQLEPGMFIGYATGLYAEATEEVQLGRLSQSSLLPWNVQPALSGVVSGEADRFWESGWSQQEQARWSAREGLEERQGQVASVCGRSFPRYRGPEESGLGRRCLLGVGFADTSDFVGGEGVRALRRHAGAGASGAEYEGASHTSQKQESEGQRPRQSGSDLSELPQQGALGGETCGWVRVEAIEDLVHIPNGDTFDLECEYAPANYLVKSRGSGYAVSHNSYGFNKSHATAYGMIAFWGMWLKTYYPLEFYWALLKNEPDRVRVQQIAKDAKRHGIELLPPHVSVSTRDFSIDDDKTAIRGSLVDIKGVGGSASDAIMASQPYAGLLDFVDRVDRRKVHRGVVLALARSGSLDGMLPNTRWFIEHIDEAWKLLTSKKRTDSDVHQMFETATAEPDFSEEEAMLTASAVNPLAFGRHPVDAYDDFIKHHIRVPIVDMSSETFFKDYDRKGVCVAGVVVEVKYNQVGDFHTGAMPSDRTKKHMFWGARYANVNVEDVGGKQNRFKFDFDIFDDFRAVIDQGIGTPVLVHATPSAFTSTLRAQFAVSLERLRIKIRDGAELDVWERIFTGKHPALSYHWPSQTVREARAYNRRFYKSPIGGILVGVVTNVRLKYDKNGHLMAFWGMLDAGLRYTEVICFASVWPEVRHVVKAGRLIKAEIERKPDRSKGWASFFNGGRIKWLKGSSESIVAE